MCMIIDANVAHAFSPISPDARPVLKWLLTGGGALIIGGHLTKELSKTKLRSTIVNLERAGRLRRQDETKVNSLTVELRNSNRCCSDDQHVLAAAIVSGCRLIFTKDKKLSFVVINRIGTDHLVLAGQWL